MQKRATGLKHDYSKMLSGTPGQAVWPTLAGMAKQGGLQDGEISIRPACEGSIFDLVS